MSLRVALLCIAAAGLVACDKSPAVTDNSTLVAAALRGRVAFAASCGSCHASADGLDLAFFSFADSTIIRRALKHVDDASARDIVAHIRTLRASQVPSEMRLFQPGGAPLTSDAQVGLTLFGRDAWPADMTREMLLALDPLKVPTAVLLPMWSVETANTDWMPDTPLPDALLDDANSAGRTGLAAYRASPTDENLVAAVKALSAATVRANGPGACHFESPGRVNYDECFQAMRWIATLGAQHMIRTGTSTALDSIVHDAWWDAGDAERRGLAAHVLTVNAEQNRVAWMYLGWMFGPDHHPTVYLTPGLVNLGLNRTATFVSLRSLVARPRGSFFPYDDLSNAAKYAPAGWAYAATRFAYEQLIVRAQAADLPPSNRLAQARANADQAARDAAPRIAAASEREALSTLSRQLLAILPVK